MERFTALQSIFNTLPKIVLFPSPCGSRKTFRFSDTLRATQKHKRHYAAWPFFSLPTRIIVQKLVYIPNLWFYTSKMLNSKDGINYQVFAPCMFRLRYYQTDDALHSNFCQVYVQWTLQMGQVCRKAEIGFLWNRAVIDAFQLFHNIEICRWILGVLLLQRMLYIFGWNIYEPDNLDQKVRKNIYS